MFFLIQDADIAENLLPLTFSRLIEEIRVGIFTIREKWDRFLEVTTTYKTSNTSSTKQGNGTFIFSHILPNQSLVNDIQRLKEGDVLVCGASKVSFCGDIKAWQEDPGKFNIIQSSTPFEKIEYPFDIFKINNSEIYKDYHLVSQGRVSASLNNSNRYSGREYIFIEDTAQVTFSTLIASKEHPIYIGPRSQVMENSLLKNGVAICEGSTVNPNAIISNGSTLGPFSKVGGEVSNSVFFSYSNKAHHGFLGNSVIGSWCNIGAGSSCSNLKNNYSPISLWNYPSKKYLRFDHTLFCGLIMGDHAKTGINTTFNTATSVGFSSSILSGKIPPKYIPSFIWDEGDRFSEHKLKKALETANHMMARREVFMEYRYRKIFKKIFTETQSDRLHFVKKSEPYK